MAERCLGVFIVFYMLCNVVIWFPALYYGSMWVKMPSACNSSPSLTSIRLGGIGSGAPLRT